MGDKDRMFVAFLVPGLDASVVLTGFLAAVLTGDNVLFLGGMAVNGVALVKSV